MKICDDSPIKLAEHGIEYIDTPEMPHTYRLDGKYLRGVSTVAGMKHKDWLAPWMLNEMEKRLLSTLKKDTKYTADQIAILIKAAKTAHKDKSKGGKASGTLAHDWIRDYQLGTPYLRQYALEVTHPGLPDGPRRSVASFLEWEAKAVKRWLYVEHIVGDKERGCCGTFDAIVELKEEYLAELAERSKKLGTAMITGGPFALIDYKTNDTFPEDSFVKTGGYMKMANLHLAEDSKEINGRIVLWFPKDGKRFMDVVVPTPIDLDWRAFMGLNVNCQWDSYYKAIQAKPWVINPYYGKRSN